MNVNVASLTAKAPTIVTLAHNGTITQNNVVFSGTWNVSFDLSLTSRDPHAVTVKVNVYAHGSGVAADDKVAWSNQIISAWSNKFKFVNPANTQQYWKVLFEVAWKGAGAGAYDVTVAPAATDFPATMTQLEKNMAASSLPEGQQYRDDVAAHRDEGTLDMGTWGKGDLQAVLHEFGHMIGCTDEYTLISCSSTPAGYVLAYDVSYNVPGYSTESVMNNPKSKSKIYERHLTYVRHVFEAWNAGATKPTLGKDTLRTARL